MQVYNLVGLVRSHSDDDAALIEVEFHNTSIHHTFSLANHHGYSIAALNEQALVLACEKNEDQPRYTCVCVSVCVSVCVCRHSDVCGLCVRINYYVIPVSRQTTS